jgi:chemotaxis protein CheX
MALTIPDAIQASVSEVLGTYLGKQPNLKATEVRKENTALGEISAIIGLTGDKVQGAFVVSVEKELLFEIMKVLLGEAPAEINEEALDMAGELANMICGSFRKRFEQMGATLKASVPSMITGKDYQIHALCKTPRVAFNFELDGKHIFVEFCLDKLG